MPDVYHELVHFSGRVQGVGFRYSTLEVAREFEVAGYVKNLADGRVQLEVEGTESQVQAFVAALQDRMHSYIREMTRAPDRRAPSFQGFIIR